MVLTAESGWMMGEHGYGEDKKKELRAAIDAYRAEEGLEPVRWDEDEHADSPLPDAGEGGSRSEAGEGAEESERSSAEPSPSPTPHDKPVRRSPGRDPGSARRPGPRVRRV
jgi:hypothetical protein